MTGMLTPACAAAAMKPATVGTRGVVEHRDRRPGALLVWPAGTPAAAAAARSASPRRPRPPRPRRPARPAASRPGRRPGLRPAGRRRPARRRSRTAPRPRPPARRPVSSCSSTIRFRSRQVSVIHGRSPAASSKEACSVGGKSGRSWCSPTSTASQDGASVAATDACIAAEYGSELKSVRISGTAPQRHRRHRYRRHSTGAANTHGCGQDLAAPVGPHPAARSHHHALRAGAGRVCIAPGSHAGTQPVSTHPVPFGQKIDAERARCVPPANVPALPGLGLRPPWPGHSICCSMWQAAATTAQSAAASARPSASSSPGRN